MENAGVDEVTAMEKDASKLWFTSLTAGAIVGLDKIIMLIALIVFRVGWWSTIYCQQILLGMLTIFGPIQWAFSLLPKWEGAWAKWLIRYLTVHFYGAMLYFVGFYVLLLFDRLLLRGLPHGGEHRGAEVPEPRPGPRGLDDPGGRHCLFYPKLRRGRRPAGEEHRHRHAQRTHHMTTLTKEIW